MARIKSFIKSTAPFGIWYRGLNKDGLEFIF